MPASSNPEPDQPDRVELYSRRATLVITNLSKLAGLIVGVNELLVRSSTTTARLAVAAVMMSGAQAVEGLFLTFLDKLFMKSDER